MIEMHFNAKASKLEIIKSVSRLVALNARGISVQAAMNGRSLFFCNENKTLDSMDAAPRKSFFFTSSMHP